MKTIPKVFSVMPLLALTCSSAFGDGRAGDEGFLLFEDIVNINARVVTDSSTFYAVPLQPGALYAVDLTISAPAGETCGGSLFPSIEFADGTSVGSVLASVQAVDGATESVSHDYTMPVRFRFKPDTDTAMLTLSLNKIGPSSPGDCTLQLSVVYVSK